MANKWNTLGRSLACLLSTNSAPAAATSSSAAVLARPQLLQAWIAPICTSARACFPDVLVPSLGESMKDGTIATVLKQVGQPVKIDEVVAQIETDKVTIDVKSPAAGFIHSVTVKAGDVVVPGQVLAAVGEGAPAGGAAAAAAGASTSSKPAAPAGSGTPSTSAASAASPAHRAHMIQFPPRRTATGERISDLPAAEAAKAALASPATSQGAAAAAAKPQASFDPAPMAGKGLPSGAPETKPAPAPQYRSAAAVTQRAGPPRRPLTQKELDMINLGGAF